MPPPGQGGRRGVISGPEGLKLHVPSVERSIDLGIASAPVTSKCVHGMEPSHGFSAQNLQPHDTRLTLEFMTASRRLITYKQGSIQQHLHVCMGQMCGGIPEAMSRTDHPLFTFATFRGSDGENSAEEGGRDVNRDIQHCVEVEPQILKMPTAIYAKRVCKSPAAGHLESKCVQGVCLLPLTT